MTDNPLQPELDFDETSPKGIEPFEAPVPERAHEGLGHDMTTGVQPVKYDRLYLDKKYTWDTDPNNQEVNEQRELKLQIIRPIPDHTCKQYTLPKWNKEIHTDIIDHIRIDDNPSSTNCLIYGVRIIQLTDTGRIFSFFCNKNELPSYIGEDGTKKIYEIIKSHRKKLPGLPNS